MIAATISPLLLLLLLACPLMMVFMMRGHGHGQSNTPSGRSDLEDGHERSGTDTSREEPSLDELRARLDELEAQIRAREDAEAERLTAAR